MPRDFEPAIGDRLGVYLYSVDDLEEAARQNRQQRDRELPAALAIIDDETRRFMEEMHHRATGPIIQRLRENWRRHRPAGTAAAVQQAAGIWTSTSATKSGQTFERYVNKMLHPPLERLRDDSRRGHPHGLLEALKRLFHLKD